MVSIAWLGTMGLAQTPTRPPLVEIPGERLELALGEPLSARALVTKPLPITAVMSWSLETRRHRGTIWCHALSPDGRAWATGGLDGTIRIWDVASGQLLRALIGHNSYVSSLDWSPDGNTLASAGTYDITVRLWDTRTGRPLRVLKGHPRETSLVRWSPDGKTVVASGGESGAFSSWNAVTGIKQSTLEIGRPILGISWHPDGKTAALVGQTMPLQLWDLEKNKVLRTVGTINDNFVSVALGPDGKTLAAGTGKNTILYDAANGTVGQTLAGPAYALAWGPGGKQLATLMPDAIKVWNAASGSLDKTIPVTGAQAFAGTHDFAHFITGSGAAYAVHETATAKTVRHFDNLAGTLPPSWWSGRPLITGLGLAKLSLWDPDTGKFLRSLDGHAGGITAVAYTPNGKILATAAADKTVRLWDVATAKPTQTFTGHAAAVLAVAIAFDNKTVASSGADKQVQIWDATTGKVLHTLADFTTDVTALAWKPASATLLVTNGKEGTVRIWNVRTGKVDKTYEGTHNIVSLAWSPDGTRVAHGQENALVHVWQATSAKALHTLEDGGSPPHVSALAWSPNGQLLAAGRGNHTMQLWDPRTGKKLHSLPTMAPVQRVSWTPGSTTIGISSHDRTARFVDAATGKLRALLLAEDDQILAVNFDGHYRAPDAETALVYVVQTKSSQETFTPSQFAAKFKLKNLPAKVSVFGK